MSMKWNITGTPNQQAVIRRAFDLIKFPFDRLTIPGTQPPELGWRDLNNGAYGSVSSEAEKGRMHGDNMHDGDKPDTLEGELEGRRWIMGVIYPGSGRIFLDLRLEAYPNMAAATLGAEIAHAVDFFLPMTDAMRDELMRLWNVPNTTWWEVYDYGNEYYRLGGEAFMHEFVAAYTDIDFGSKSSFTHDHGVEAADIWRVLGIKRTDYVEPVPEKPKVQYVYYPKAKSKIYHEPGHYPRKAGTLIEEPTALGYRLCKTCARRSTTAT